MLARLIICMAFYFSASNIHASEPQLSPELKCYSWMVGDWAAEKVWSPESAFDPNRSAQGRGNPNSQVSVIDGGNGLRIEYGYRIASGIWQDADLIDYRYTETVRVDGDYFLISGERVRTEDSTEQKKSYKFRVHRGDDSRDWAWKLRDENQLMRICGNPKASDVVILVCKRDDTRSNPKYVPFTPKTPGESISAEHRSP